MIVVGSRAKRSHVEIRFGTKPGETPHVEGSIKGVDKDARSFVATVDVRGLGTFTARGLNELDATMLAHVMSVKLAAIASEISKRGLAAMHVDPLRSDARE